MNDEKGLIFDIQGFSVHDGPGSRTTVFLSGCPLQCRWCANPEGWKVKQRLMYSRQKCRADQEGCRRCIDACSRKAIGKCDEGIAIDRALCESCEDFRCAQSCFQEALRLSGRWYHPEELMKILARDRNYWTGGGVTFSGGEPLMQKTFILEVLKRCRAAGIHTAVETTAFVEHDFFLEAMSYIDFAFIDIKHMDETMHRAETGVSNQLILSNIKALAQSQWRGRFILRIPVIKGYNDSKDNIQKAIDFMEETRLQEINLLPFHRMGDSKWSQLGERYDYRDAEVPSDEELQEMQKLFSQRGLSCYIAEDVNY